MARQGTIFSDENNVCPLDSPIPLSVYKNFKKNKMPRSARDHIKNQLKYRFKDDTLDDTAYDRTYLNKEIEEFLLHNFKLSNAFAYDEGEIERAFQANFGTAFDEFLKEFGGNVNFSDEDNSSSSSSSGCRRMGQHGAAFGRGKVPA